MESGEVVKISCGLNGRILLYPIVFKPSSMKAFMYVLENYCQWVKDTHGGFYIFRTASKKEKQLAVSEIVKIWTTFEGKRIVALNSNYFL